MPFARLRRYDVQATYSFWLSVASLVPFLATAALVYRNYDQLVGRIVYGSTGKFLPAFGGGILLSMVLGAIGFLLGLSSAGQRRNDKPARSWIGFFVGGGVLTFNLILLLAFYMLRLEM